MTHSPSLYTPPAALPVRTTAMNKVKSNGIRHVLTAMTVASGSGMDPFESRGSNSKGSEKGVAKSQRSDVSKSASSQLKETSWQEVRREQNVLSRSYNQNPPQRRQDSSKRRLLSKEPGSSKSSEETFRPKTLFGGGAPAPVPAPVAPAVVGGNAGQAKSSTATSTTQATTTTPPPAPFFCESSLGPNSKSLSLISDASSDASSEQITSLTFENRGNTSLEVRLKFDMPSENGELTTLNIRSKFSPSSPPNPFSYDGTTKSFIAKINDDLSLRVKKNENGLYECGFSFKGESGFIDGCAIKENSNTIQNVTGTIPTSSSSYSQTTSPLIVLNPPPTTAANYTCGVSQNGFEIQDSSNPINKKIALSLNATGATANFFDKEIKFDGKTFSLNIDNKTYKFDSRGNLTAPDKLFNYSQDTKSYEYRNGEAILNLAFSLNSRGEVENFTITQLDGVGLRFNIDGTSRISANAIINNQIAATCLAIQPIITSQLADKTSVRPTTDIPTSTPNPILICSNITHDNILSGQSIGNQETVISSYSFDQRYDQTKNFTFNVSFNSQNRNFVINPDISLHENYQSIFSSINSSSGANPPFKVKFENGEIIFEGDDGVKLNLKRNANGLYEFKYDNCLSISENDNVLKHVTTTVTKSSSARGSTTKTTEKPTTTKLTTSTTRATSSRPSTTSSVSPTTSTTKALINFFSSSAIPSSLNCTKSGNKLNISDGGESIISVDNITSPNQYGKYLNYKIGSQNLTFNDNGFTLDENLIAFSETGEYRNDEIGLTITKKGNEGYEIKKGKLTLKQEKQTNGDVTVTAFDGRANAGMCSYNYQGIMNAFGAKSSTSIQVYDSSTGLDLKAATTSEGIRVDDRTSNIGTSSSVYEVTLGKVASIFEGYCKEFINPANASLLPKDSLSKYIADEITFNQSLTTQDDKKVKMDELIANLTKIENSSKSTQEKENIAKLIDHLKNCESEHNPGKSDNKALAVGLGVGFTAFFFVFGFGYAVRDRLRNCAKARQQANAAAGTAFGTVVFDTTLQPTPRTDPRKREVRRVAPADDLERGA